jgi:putative copper export protein
LAALPDVMKGTEFGHLLLAQLGLVLLAAAWPGGRVAVVLAGLAVLLQTGHGHAASMTSHAGLLVVDAVHVAAAACWLGCLPPLVLVTWIAPQRAAAAAARSFTPLGWVCVLGLAASAAVQGWELIGDVPGLVGTAYGWLALGKFGLLIVLAGFAIANRYRLALALVGERPERARVRLMGSITAQAGFGVAVLLAAAVLTSLPPAVHEQPVWPFDLRFSLDAVREDPDFRREVVTAAVALAVAVLLLIGAALIRRRWTLVGVAGAVVIAWTVLPHFDLLLASANPDIYFRSPTGFTAAAIARGQELYAPHCASCHGAQGRGDGPAAAGMAVPPADLTAGHLWMHSDGELFWWLAHGIEAPEGDGLAMPGFAEALTDDDRWDLIDFIRARNAGLAGRSGMPWGQAPDFVATCPDGRTVTLAALRGRIVRLAIGVVPPVDSGPDVTIVAGSEALAHCVTDDAAVPQAYAIAAGLDPAKVVGAQFLIDGSGWLRDVQTADARPGWADDRTLSTAIGAIRAHPRADVDNGGGMRM